MGLVSYDAVRQFRDFRAPRTHGLWAGIHHGERLACHGYFLEPLACRTMSKGLCYTSYDARAYLNNTADVGTSVDFKSEEGDFEFSVGTPSAGVRKEHF